MSVERKEATVAGVGQEGEMGRACGAVTGAQACRASGPASGLSSEVRFGAESRAEEGCAGHRPRGEATLRRLL